MHPEPQRILEVHGLSKSYGAFQALKQVSFEVSEGECFGILGPNGAGKTTLMRTLYGVSPIEEGDIFACGLNMKTSPYQIKSLLGVVPQENGLDPDFSALDNLSLFGQYFGLSERESRARGVSLLRQLEMESISTQLVAELSGGEARKLVLARALVPHPRLLFLDEPTTGFDPNSRIKIWDFLESLNTEKLCTTILTTHNMEEAQRLCERVAVLNHGEILAMGAPNDLIQKFVGSQVVEFFCKEHEVRYFSSKLKGRCDLQVFRTGFRVYNANSTELLGYFTQLQADSLIIRKGTLEDVFFKLSGIDFEEETFSEREF